MGGWIGSLNKLSLWLHVITSLGFGVKATFIRSCNTSPSHFSRMTMNEAIIGTEENYSPIAPLWCEEQQIYLGGVVPEYARVNAWLEQNGGYLRLFGYGSLCWNPGGDGATLSKPGVTATLGRAKGYRRCWAQRSADHRGTPRFPGIVCTILRDQEVLTIRRRLKHGVDDVAPDPSFPTLTEGVLYTVPPELAQECLAELDFREKGGYARDIIDVEEIETGNTVQALLYRGTPDNPGFWPRALLDLPFAAAVMSVAVGPSGRNDDYLNSLNQFLTEAMSLSTSSADVVNDHLGDSDTPLLSVLTRTFQQMYRPFFLFGSGSNQHNQLLLASDMNVANLLDHENAHQLTEILVCVTRDDNNGVLDRPKQIVAGGGHSGLLTEHGRLFLWGWREHGQLGTSGNGLVPESPLPLPLVNQLQDLLVEKVALGFSHTLVIEKETGYLFAFGCNERGQVNGIPSNSSICIPQRLPGFTDCRFAHISGGLFHSAAITAEGELITFGCGRFGQALSSFENDSIGRWKPKDGAKLVQVACGRHHTIVLDEQGRVWTFGENKYGQLGRAIEGKFDAVPALVDLSNLELPVSGCCEIVTGWSHTIVKVDCGNGKYQFYGWGRNDKGQLGTGSSLTEHIRAPIRLFESIPNIESVVCGSEFTMLCKGEGSIWGCGWNEHGNLSLGTDYDAFQMTKIQGAKITSPPQPYTNNPVTTKLKMAAGGAHFLAMLM